MFWDLLTLGMGCGGCDYVYANLFTLVLFIYIFKGLLKIFNFHLYLVPKGPVSVRKGGA